MEAGPPVCKDLPVPRKRPVPMVPPMAIIWTCRADSLRASLSAMMCWEVPSSLRERAGSRGFWSSMSTSLLLASGWFASTELSGETSAMVLVEACVSKMTEIKEEAKSQETPLLVAI
jgi:hypothetical protein